MSYPDNLFSTRAEANCIGGMIKNPKVLIDILNDISENEFYHKVHRTIFSVIRSLVFDDKNIDKVVIAQKCRELGINNFEELNLFDYIDSLSFTSINPSGLKELIGELIKLRIKREIWDNTLLIQEFIKENGTKNIDEIISGADSLYNSRLVQYKTQIEPVDLYGNIEEFLRKIAANPIDEVGFKTPYSEWNRLFGGVRQKQTTNIISRSGEGKSCFLFNMAKHICKINNVKAIYIDTEMDLDLNMIRAGAAEIGINAWYLETGQWTKAKEINEKVIVGFDKLNKYKGSIYHIYLPNKNIQEAISLIKRWYYKNVGKGNKCVIVYDYLKITEALDRNKMEYQALGDKCNALNELSHELDSAVLSAGQQNRAAENQGFRNDDSTTAAVSDRINHLVGFNAVFRKKTDDEKNEFGDKFGSHLLKPFKTSRVQGKDNYNLNSMIKVIDSVSGKTRYKQNFLNYDIFNYDLIEKGTYQDIVKNLQLNKNLQADKPKGEHDI